MHVEDHPEFHWIIICLQVNNFKCSVCECGYILNTEGYSVYRVSTKCKLLSLMDVDHQP